MPGYAKILIPAMLFIVAAGSSFAGENPIPFEKKGKWGYIDKKGAVVIPFRYEEARDFENGKARVKTGGKWIYIDGDGNKTTAP
ncbi:MAG: WG repeat-containing protein [Deltaproteobacteria bacterium]|nr:WG repeat-containing protein [Deltaproteobacteria bacterium]